MFAEAKAKRVQTSGPLAVHVELVGLLEDFSVTVGRLVGRNDALVGLNKLENTFSFHLPACGCRKLWAHLATNLNVNLSCSLHGQRGRGMIPAEFLNERGRK